MKDHTMKDLSYEEVEAATRGFALEMLIGKGSHGFVYKGILRGGRCVAVKKLSSGLRATRDVSKLEMEIEILASVDCPHLVNLVGVCCNETEKLIVTEFMPRGSLYDLLHVLPKPPTWSRRLLMALQIAQAVQALHQASPPIIHRDIKSSNILIDSCRNARLADFSLAVRDAGASQVAKQSPPPPAPAGTIGYLDPCYTRPRKLGPKNDIFSYGVVLLELISGRRVMDTTCETTSIVAWSEPLLSSGLVAELCDARMALSRKMEMIIGRVLRMAARCISSDVERRPSAGEITQELQAIIKQLHLSVWNHLKINFSDRIVPYLSIWQMQRSRITATKIVCTDHLGDGDDSDDRRITRSEDPWPLS